MREPRIMYGHIVDDVMEAESALNISYDHAADIDTAAQLMALRSIAHSQLAIAKLLLRQEGTG